MTRSFRFPRFPSFAGAALATLALVAGTLALSSCGGGGSSSSTPIASSSGGGGTPTSLCASNPSVQQPTTGNVAILVMDAGPVDPATSSCVNALNAAFTSVTVCTPGSTSACKTIDHVLVDTGSSGLRLMSSVLGTTPALPASASGGQTLVECLQFADGYSWGTVRTADLYIAGEKAANLPIQVIGDTSVAVPSDCSNGGRAENTVSSFAANGVLGVGLFEQDCGTACVAPNVFPGTYYQCSATSCTGTSVALGGQVPNPVTLFGTDSNGVILQLPATGASGAIDPTGRLYFGIGTQADNALVNATVYAAYPSGNGNAGNFVATYKGATYSASFLDSGSNLMFLPDATITTCPTGDVAQGFFCPAATIAGLAVKVTGANNVSGTYTFDIANAHNLLTGNPTATTFNDIGAPDTIIAGGGGLAGVDLGMPFFLGRNVYVGVEGFSAGGNPGPFWAF